MHLSQSSSTHDDNRKNSVERYVAFGNDQNDIGSLKKLFYAVQIGDFPALQPYADDQLVAKQINHKLY